MKHYLEAMVNGGRRAWGEVRAGGWAGGVGEGVVTTTGIKNCGHLHENICNTHREGSHAEAESHEVLVKL